MPLVSHNPTTGQIIGSFQSWNAETLADNLAQAHHSQEDWKVLKFTSRAKVLKLIADQLRSHVERLAKLASEEMGKPLAESRAEVNKCAMICEFYADHAESFLSPQSEQTDATRSYVNYEPLGIILAIMITPFIASVMRDVFEVTPPMLKESAYALGSTTWEVVSKVVLPFTKTGVVGGIMLGLGRAIGETMAVTFVIGNFNQLNSLSLFEAANSITSALANEFAEADAGLHQASLMYLGLVLFVITFTVLAMSKLMLNQLRKNEGTSS
jgi:ABC-type molybdate transport system permease subunit